MPCAAFVAVSRSVTSQRLAQIPFWRLVAQESGSSVGLSQCRGGMSGCRARLGSGNGVHTKTQRQRSVHQDGTDLPTDRHVEQAYTILFAERNLLYLDDYIRSLLLVVYNLTYAQ